VVGAIMQIDGQAKILALKKETRSLCANVSLLRFCMWTCTSINCI